MNNKKFTKLTIKNPDEISRLLDYLHDEFFEIEDIKYDETKRILKIPYRRIFHNGPSRVIRNWIIGRTIEVDVLRCLLRIKNTEKYEITDEAHIGVYSFNSLKYNKESKQLIFTCCEPCELRVNISEINIEYEELEYRSKARITQGFCWDSNSSKIYD